jgi:hypothetical protein
MIIKNLTPHAINVCDDNGKVYLTIEAEAVPARLKVRTELVQLFDTIRITKSVFGEPEGLPDYQEDVYYVVSQLIKSAFPERMDLLVPAEVVRDTNGNIVGCKSLGI